MTALNYRKPNVKKIIISDYLMKQYPELTALEQLIQEQGVRVIRSNHDRIAELIPVELTIQQQSLIVYIEDEYHDLDRNNHTLAVVLALRELECINESTDYLDWCSEMGIKTHHEELRQYYQELILKIPTLNTYFPNNRITCFINNLDFQLNAGAIQFLRQ